MGNKPSARSSTPVSSLAATYYHKPNAREMYTPQKPPADIKSLQQWTQANAQARRAANPQRTPYSLLEAPVVSHLDPHQMTENPLDPFQDNIYYTLTTFKNRNTNFDPRGQPELPADWQSGGGDSLIQIRNVERLAYHGASHQITGCVAAKAPKY